MKLHIGTDTLGLPHGVSVTAANIDDRKGIPEMMSVYRSGLSRILKVLGDGGFTGENFETAVRELLGAVVEIAKRSDLHKFVVIPKRWIVERTYGWPDKYRRFWKNCERYTDTLEQLVVVAFIRLILRRY